MTIRLTGDGILLRAFREDEFEVVWAHEVAEPEGPDTEDTPERRERLYARLRSSGGWTTDDLRLAVEADGVLVGDAQARRSVAAMPTGVTELGLTLFPESRGKGVGTQVLRTISRYLFEEEGFHRVQLSTDVENLAMRRAAEKAGFTFEGVLRGFWVDGDRLRDYAMYARTREDHVAG